MNDFFYSLEKQNGIILNEQQKAAAVHKKGPALVLAGPGSGKTTVITVRTAYLIFEEGINPESILTLTFNKAAQLEMKNRFERLFGKGNSNGALFSTLHSFCYSVIRDYQRRQGRSLTLIEGDGPGMQANKQRILKELYKEINGAPLNEEELETLINEIGLVKNRMQKDFSGLELRTRNFESIYRAYDEFKKKNLYMDFDDMLAYCYGILNKCPDILESYRKRHRFYQVDEGQDLSRIQFEILKMLVYSKENNIFIVADDDQSIYGFRGADPQCILGLEKHFKGLTLYKLETNYRSSRTLVEHTSRFIKNNQERFDKNHNTANPENAPPIIARIKDERAQLGYLEKKIKEHRKQDNNIKIAVLYRNNLSSVALADWFDRRGIACRLRQNRLIFFRHWLIQDICAFLNFALDSSDWDAFQRICYKMNRYISKDMVENAVASGAQHSVIDAILSRSDLKPFQELKLKDLSVEFKKLSRMAPLQALKYIEHDFKYFAGVKEFCDTSGLSFDYLYGLFGILKTLASGCKTVPAFLARLDELAEMLDGKPGKESPRGDTPHAVALTTLHSSKGLEYDVVFMVDLTNAEIPGERAFVKAGKGKCPGLMEEERRLFYVGMTRAKSWLYLVSPDEVNEKPVPRSIFVNEAASIINGGVHDHFAEGVPIRHKKYGKGVIAKVSAEPGATIIEADFNGLTRKFDLGICLENGIISLE